MRCLISERGYDALFPRGDPYYALLNAVFAF